MPYEIVKPGTKIDFIGKRRLCAMLSAGLIIASLIATQVNGIKLGIDYEGGTEVQLTFEPQVDVTEGPIREIVSEIDGIDDPSVIRYGDPVDNEFLVKFQGSVKTGDASAGADMVTEIQRAVIADIGPLRGGKVSRVEFVGPKVGPELRRDGL